MDWNDKTNWTVSFHMPVDEKMKEFMDRMEKESKERYEAFEKRIRTLFKEHIGFTDEVPENVNEQVLQVFGIGYQLGWNDHYDLIKDK